MREDRYAPGEFFYGIDLTLNKYRPHSQQSKHELVLGNPDQVFLSALNGNSTTAEFSYIVDAIQPNQTKLVIADSFNSCIRQYNLELDLVTTLIGHCSYSEAKKPNQRHLNLGETANATENVFDHIFSLAFVETKNLLLLGDHSKGTILLYSFNTEQVSLLAPIDSFTSVSSILVNPDDTIIYASYDFGISTINLQSGVITPLVQGGSTTSVLPGVFDKAHPGVLDSLSWIIPGKVFMGLPSMEKGSVIIDLEASSVSTLCSGMFNSLYCF